MRYMLMHNMTPVFKHDCDHCEFLGTIEIEHNGMTVDLYACLHDRRDGPDGSILARYGDEPNEYISHSVFRGYVSAPTSVWAQVASIFADLSCDPRGVDVSKFIPGIKLRFCDLRIVKNPVYAFTDSPLFRDLMADPEIGDLVYTRPGNQRTVTAVLGKKWKLNAGRRVYHLRDNTEREFLGAKIINDEKTEWASV